MSSPACSMFSKSLAKWCQASAIVIISAFASGEPAYSINRSQFSAYRRYSMLPARPRYGPQVQGRVVGVGATNANGSPEALAIKNATASLPVVMTAVADPVGAGIVASLAHPGGNFTGMVSFATELAGKRIEMLRELIPTAKLVAAIEDPGNLANTKEWEVIRDAARTLRIEALRLEVRNAEDVIRAFDEARRQRVDAIYVDVNSVTRANQRLISSWPFCDIQLSLWRVRSRGKADVAAIAARRRAGSFHNCLSAAPHLYRASWGHQSGLPADGRGCLLIQLWPDGGACLLHDVLRR
jgi:hypothetical protein